MRIGIRGLAALALIACGCAGQPGESSGPNPFLEDQSNQGKADTAYMNPDGIEVEVDLEADVEASAYQIFDAPAMLGQFALTYLRNRGEFYLESLAEAEGSDQRIEWKVDGAWLTAAQARAAAPSKLTHWRLKAVNAVLLHQAATGVTVGKVFTATVPRKPYTMMAEWGEKCANKDDHLGLDQSIYWYQWNPELSTCTCPKQDMTVTISKLSPVSKITYPEYDQLVADGKITAVILFGKIGEGSVESDSGMYAFKQMAKWLTDAKFTEVKPAPVGRRFTKKYGAVSFEIDLYSPADFSGLDDYAHFNNFQKAISEHEIIAYDGHSMLGGSDFWARPTYPAFYQIYLYGGCLGYEYYVKHIVDGKGGTWDKLDIMSSVVEVSANANEFAGPVLAKIMYALEHENNVSWKDLLTAVRQRVGDSTFGASGVRGNCYSPSGSLCGGSSPTRTTKTYESTTVLTIPDNNTTGVKGTIEVPDTLTAKTFVLDLDVTHTYVGDLKIVLSHGTTNVTVWNNAGGSQKGIKQSFTLAGFAGKDVKGTWTLKVVDNAAMDTGTVNRWALIVTP
ncbi:MAG TPA: proprotein convertase P-domain-containing protein [Polyangia bacterium]|jgi:hypothetical protein